MLERAEFFDTLTDEMRYREALALGWHLAVQEGVNFAGTAAAQRTVVAVIADVLHALGAVTTTFDARTILTSVIALDGMLASGWKQELIDTVEFQEALAAQIENIAKLVDGISFADTATPAMRLVAIAADTVDFGDESLPSMEMFERLADEVLFYGVIRLGDTEYTGWTLNKGASTEYRNYPMNGLLVGDDERAYGTSSSGLYLLEGPDDDGEDIEWSIKTGVMDFLTGKLKRVPDCYLAFAGGGTVYLKVITEGEDGRRHAHIYTAVLRPGDALHNDRISIGRGLSARYWQFELAGTGAFELDELAWRPLVLDRRLR